MNKLQKWLLEDTKVSPLAKLRNVGAAFTLCLLWVAVVEVFYKWLFTRVPAGGQEYPWYTLPKYLHEWWIVFIGGCIFAPIWEELVFRKLWLDYMITIDKGKLILPAILFSSIIFGLGHDGIFSLPIQGVMGVVFSVVYLRNGRSYWPNVLLHALWNSALTFGWILNN